MEENALKYRACKEAFQTTRVLARRDQMSLDHFHLTPPSPRDPAPERCVSSQTSGFSLLPAALGGIQQTFPLPTDLTRGRRVTPRIFKHLHWELPSSWIRVSRTYCNQHSTLKLHCPIRLHLQNTNSEIKLSSISELQLANIEPFGHKVLCHCVGHTH